MKFHSTSGKHRNYSLEQVLTAGLAPDGGLFMPNAIPSLSPEFIQRLPRYSLPQIAARVAEKFMPEMPLPKLQAMLRGAFDFPAPLKKLQDNLYILELFHGPTFAFKDFGARFLARALAYFLEHKKEELNIIVATSGDTGSAVASGFFRVPHIRVFILYPSGRVSPLQERQLTTYGENIIALEVQGSFDDCQALAKAALNDPELASQAKFSSANSINFGRLLPQTFYYFHALAELRRAGVRENPVIVVPSGNFGNLTAGLLAKRMGLPVKHFIAATNRNSVFPDYLATGLFKPRPSKATPSNAMDVGNPSNFARILELYQGDCRRMTRDITGTSITDIKTRRTIQKIYREFHPVREMHPTASRIVHLFRTSTELDASYEFSNGVHCLLDPHTAVGVAAALETGLRDPTVVLSTAHPAKFREILESWLRIKVPLPQRLSQIMCKKKKSIIIKNDLSELKQTILSKIHA